MALVSDVHPEGHLGTLHERACTFFKLVSEPAGDFITYVVFALSLLCPYGFLGRKEGEIDCIIFPKCMWVLQIHVMQVCIRTVFERMCSFNPNENY